MFKAGECDFWTTQFFQLLGFYFIMQQVTSILAFWIVMLTGLLISSISDILLSPFGAGIIFLILAHPVYKMWIIQEPNMLELWNKLHFEEEKTDSIHHV